MKKSVEIILVAIILGAMFGLMLWSSLKEVPIIDEVPHIGAGYSSLLRQDGRLNPEHPPLVKYLAAIPLLFMDLKFPDTKAWNEDVNGQWEFGAQLLYDEGNDGEKMIHWTRILPMLLTLLLGLYVYKFVKKYFKNRVAAFGALFLYAFSPVVLAHGHYVTTDIGAAFAFIFSIYYFLKFIHEPSKKNLLFAGLAFGIAQLLKFSSILLIPTFVIGVFVFFIAGLAGDWQKTDPALRFKRFGIRLLRYIKSLVIIFGIGYILVWAVYFYHTWNMPRERQLRDTTFILQSSPIRLIADLDIALTKNSATKPLGWYALGLLMASQRAEGGNTTYFLGQVSATGSHIYFPIVYAIKETLPALIIVFMAFITALSAGMLWLKYGKTKDRFWEFLSEVRYHFPAVILLIAAAIYWFTAITSPLNIGIRHLLPAIVIMHIVSITWLLRNSKFRMASVFIGFLILWHIGTGISSTPHFISYFNQTIAGSANGYKYVVDSNLDWGQDLKGLSEFARQNNISKIYVDYFGWARPWYKDYLGDKFIWFIKENGPPPPGSWLAVSGTFLQGSCRNEPPCRISKDPGQDQTWYDWLRNIKPVKVIGNSIFVYHL